MIFITVSHFSSHQRLSSVFFNSANCRCHRDTIQSRIWCHWVHGTWSLCVLGHTIHQTSQLFHDCLYQLLFVSIILPELGKYIVLFASILHPRNICEWRSLIKEIIYAVTSKESWGALNYLTLSLCLKNIFQRK